MKEGKQKTVLKKFLVAMLSVMMTVTFIPTSLFAFAGETEDVSDKAQTVETEAVQTDDVQTEPTEDVSDEVQEATTEDAQTEPAKDAKAEEMPSDDAEEVVEDEAKEAVAGELSAGKKGSYKITIIYDESAGIPEGAELEVKEIESGSLKYWNYNRKAKKAVEGTDEFKEVISKDELNRFFDISIVVDGKEIEPEASVEVKISYNDSFSVEEDESLQIVHFADEGTEVITPDVNGNDIVFEQDSFSVTGTVVANLNDANNLVLIAEANGKYYEVRYDGSLKEVSFDGTTMTVGSEVEIDMAERWNRSRNRLRVSANNTYTYISPTAASGLSATSTTLTYNNNLLSATAGGTTYYLGVNEAGTAITGQNEQADAARFYLATVPTPTGNTVDHIDIAVQATASVSVPLAYGPYYDASGTQILMVEQGQAVNAKGTNSNIPITQDDLKGSTVSSYTGDHVPLNNFVITSFTVSEQTGEPDQVRYNGTFPVGTSASSADKVYYNVDVTKPVELTLTYDTDGDGEYETLYDMDGQPLVVTVVTSLDASFDYWDSRNECPGILDSWQVNQWRQGQFVTGNGGGMDFRLGTADESDATLTAIEIVKTLVDENGDTITLPEDEEIVFNFGIYQDPDGNVTAPTAWSGETTAAIDYSGYSTNDSRTVTVGSSGMGLAYDYDVVDGMTYIKETGAVPQTITDADGVTRKYDRTYITTEYVWRDDNGKTHSNVNQSDTMSSIPEVVGDYYYLDSDGKTITSWTDDDGKEHDLHNTFLEFYVTNVYVPETTEATFKKEWSPSAPNGATVEFTLYDDGEATNYKVTLDGAADTTVPTSAGGYESAAWTAKFVNLPNDGSTYTAVETGTYTGYTASGSPASDGGTITNTQDKGSVKITKTFAGLPAGTDTSKLAFSIKVGDETRTVTYKDFTNGEYLIEDLPVGTVVSVEETNAETLVANYSLVANKSTTKGTATAAKDQTKTIALVNTYEQDKGSVKITKTFAGLPAGTDTSKLAFSIKVGDETRTVTYKDFTNGEYLIEDLPVGTVVSVEETNAETLVDNYTLVADSSTTSGNATVAKDETKTIELVNTYEQDVEPGTVIVNPPVTKVVEGDAPEKAETYTFQMKAISEAAKSKMPAGSNGSVKTTTITGEGTSEFGDIEYTEQGLYEYEITEVAGSNPDCEYDDTVYAVQACVTEKDGELQLDKKDYKLEGNEWVETAEFVFTNTYTTEENGTKTGDNANILGALALLLMAGAGLGGLYFTRRRKDQN